MKSRVYFTREISPEAVVRLYRALGVSLPGKVAVKVHSGEKETRIFCVRRSGGLWWRKLAAL